MPCDGRFQISCAVFTCLACLVRYNIVAITTVPSGVWQIALTVIPSTTDRLQVRLGTSRADSSYQGKRFEWEGRDITRLLGQVRGRLPLRLPNANPSPRHLTHHLTLAVRPRVEDSQLVFTDAGSHQIAPSDTTMQRTQSTSASRHPKLALYFPTFPFDVHSLFL